MQLLICNFYLVYFFFWVKEETVRPHHNFKYFGIVYSNLTDVYDWLFSTGIKWMNLNGFCKWMRVRVYFCLCLFSNKTVQLQLLLTTFEYILDYCVRISILCHNKKLYITFSKKFDKFVSRATHKTSNIAMVPIWYEWLNWFNCGGCSALNTKKSRSICKPPHAYHGAASCSHSTANTYPRGLHTVIVSVSVSV